jgi:hypothetical protein
LIFTLISSIRIKVREKAEKGGFSVVPGESLGHGICVKESNHPKPGRIGKKAYR